MNNGFLGITYLQPGVLRTILIGRYRGLLPLAPVVGIAVIALVLAGGRFLSATNIISMKFNGN
jgi:hypothetical protein